MGCGSSNAKENFKKDRNTLEKILARKSQGYIEDSLLMEDAKGDRIELVSNEKKLKNLYNICEFNEIVDLHDLFFLDSSFYSFFEKIGRNNKMHTLSLRNIEFEGKTEYIAYLAKTLENNFVLKKVKLLSLIKPGKKLAKSIAKILQDSPNVEKITLVELDFTDADSEFLGKILSNNYPNFKILKLSGIFLGENIKYFLEGLKDNSSIEELSLQKMNLRKENISFLLHSLKNNNHLLSLDISNNPIGGAVKYFRDDQEYFNSLKTLKMNNCDIDDNNIVFLLESFFFNKSIECLELNNNQLTNVCKTHFISFFNLNESVKTIYLLKNKIYKRQVSSSFKNKDIVKMVMEI